MNNAESFGVVEHWCYYAFPTCMGRERFKIFWFNEFRYSATKFLWQETRFFL